MIDCNLHLYEKRVVATDGKNSVDIEYNQDSCMYQVMIELVNKLPTFTKLKKLKFKMSADGMTRISLLTNMRMPFPWIKNHWEVKMNSDGEILYFFRGIPVVQQSE